MSESYQELLSEYQSGNLSAEKWEQWQEFYRHKPLEQTTGAEDKPLERIGTLDATEYRVSDTQNKDADTRPMTAFESMVAGLIDLGWPVFVLALIVLDFIF